VIEESQRIDPLNRLVWSQISYARYSQGRIAEAEQAGRRAHELSDHGNPTQFYTAMNLAQIGRPAEAIAILDDVASVLGDSPYGCLSAFMARAMESDAERAARHVTPLLEQSARWVEYLALFLGCGYALIGRRDDALRWLTGAVQQGFINYPFFTRVWFLESLRGDAEYEALMQQVERRWKAFDA
jgi:tetratricopeptide (TPR) repeat protein